MWVSNGDTAYFRNVTLTETKLKSAYVPFLSLECHHISLEQVWHFTIEGSSHYGWKTWAKDQTELGKHCNNDISCTHIYRQAS